MAQHTILPLVALWKRHVLDTIDGEMGQYVDWVMETFSLRDSAPFYVVALLSALQSLSYISFIFDSPTTAY